MVIIFYFFLLNKIELSEPFDELVSSFEVFLWKNLDNLRNQRQWAIKPYFLIAAAICYARKDRMDEARTSLESARKRLSEGIPHPQLVIDIYGDFIKIILAAITHVEDIRPRKVEGGIFVSYSHAQKDLVRTFVRAAKRRTVTVVGDHMVKIGDHLDENIEQLMRRANGAVLFVSKEYLKSRFAQAERKYFQLIKRIFPKFTLIVVLIDLSHKQFIKAMPLLSDTKYVVLEGKQASVFAEIFDALDGTPRS
jgi:hypothetical protein